MRPPFVWAHLLIIKTFDMESTATPTQTIQLTIDIDASMKRSIKQVLKQIKGVIAVKETTPKARMSEAEYYAMLDRSIEQANNGQTVAIEEGETVHDFLNRLVCTQ